MSFLVKNRNLIVLHLTVFVWGFTGILGALISINEVHLVYYRVLIASISLWIYIVYKKINYQVNKISFFKLIFTGAIIALHWVLFFGSIKASTVSVGMVCLSSITLFTAILEPILSKTNVKKIEIFIGLMIIFGIYLIFKFETQYKTGIIMGLLSALCASLFSIINSKFIKSRAAPIISFYELSGAFLWISIYIMLTNGYNNQMKLSISDSLYLLILGTLCTSIAYVAGVSVMKELSAFRVALVTNLEPVYAILLALVIFGEQEQMSGGFYIGAFIILVSIFTYPILIKKLDKINIKNNKPLQ